MERPGASDPAHGCFANLWIGRAQELGQRRLRALARFHQRANECFADAIVLFILEGVTNGGKRSRILELPERPRGLETCVSRFVVQESQQSGRCLRAVLVHLADCPGSRSTHVRAAIAGGRIEDIESVTILDISEAPNRCLAHTILRVTTRRCTEGRNTTSVLDVAQCPGTHLPNARVSVVSQLIAKSVDSLARLEVSQRPCCNSADGGRVILAEYSQESR